MRADARGSSGARGLDTERGWRGWWGDRGRSPGPQPRTGEGRAPALRAKVSEPSGCGLDSCFRIYLYIYHLAPPPSPLLLFSTPSFSDHTRSSRTRQLSHSRPPPRRSGEGRRNLLGCGGRRGGDKGVAGSGADEGRRGESNPPGKLRRSPGCSARGRRRRRRMGRDGFGLFFYS